MPLFFNGEKIEQIHFLTLQHRTDEIAISKGQKKHKTPLAAYLQGLMHGLHECYQGGLFSTQGMP